jgi:hypothetical protein
VVRNPASLVYLSRPDSCAQRRTTKRSGDIRMGGGSSHAHLHGVLLCVHGWDTLG